MDQPWGKHSSPSPSEANRRPSARSRQWERHSGGVSGNLESCVPWRTAVDDNPLKYPADSFQLTSVGERLTAHNSTTACRGFPLNHGQSRQNESRNACRFSPLVVAALPCRTSRSGKSYTCKFEDGGCT